MHTAGLPANCLTFTVSALSSGSNHLVQNLKKGTAIPLLPYWAFMTCYRPKFTFALPFLSGLMCSVSQTGAASTGQCCHPSNKVAEVTICYGIAFQKSVDAELRGLCQPSNFRGNTTFQKPALIPLEREIFSHCAPYLLNVLRYAPETGSCPCIMN